MQANMAVVVCVPEKVLCHSSNRNGDDNSEVDGRVRSCDNAGRSNVRENNKMSCNWYDYVDKFIC